MQIKVFSIPIPDGELLNEELNKFLRSHKILKVDEHVVSNKHGNFWCFSIRYVEGVTVRDRERIDYKEVLDESTFQRFASLREIRKQLALEDAVPPFVIFTDEELSHIAKAPIPLTLEGLRKIQGIGEKKLGKYGEKLIQLLKDAPG